MAKQYKNINEYINSHEGDYKKFLQKFYSKSTYSDAQKTKWINDQLKREEYSSKLARGSGREQKLYLGQKNVAYEKDFQYGRAYAEMIEQGKSNIMYAAYIRDKNGGRGTGLVGLKTDAQYTAEDTARQVQEDANEEIDFGGGDLVTEEGRTSVGSGGGLSKKRQKAGGLFGRYSNQDSTRRSLLG